jgi:hypothetical protein
LIHLACTSVGNTVFLSQDKDSSIMFVSGEKSLFGKDHQNSLKQTALRSLCEVINLINTCSYDFITNFCNFLDHDERSGEFGVFWRFPIKFFVLHVQSQRQFGARLRKVVLDCDCNEGQNVPP